MAPISVSMRFDVVLRGGAHSATAIRAAVRETRDWTWSEDQQYSLDMTVTDIGGRVAVRLECSGTAEDTNPRSGAWQLQQLADDLDERVQRLVRLWASGAPATRDLAALGAALEDEPPQVSVRVPLLAVDRDVVINDEAGRRTVTASIREIYPFSSDQEERLRAVQVHVDRGVITVTAPSIAAAVDGSAAYLTAERRKAKPWAALPPTPLWAWASAAIALMSFGLSWVPLTWATLALLAALAAAIAVAALALAPRLIARRSVTAWGMAPVLTLLLFACAYGAIGLLNHGAITINGMHLHHIREPLLLSLSLLTTVGVLDLHVHQWVRSLAYLEMLLVAGLAGGAAVVAVRRVSARVERIVDELQRDQAPQDR